MLRGVLRPPAPADSGIPIGEQHSLQRDGMRAAAAVLGTLLGAAAAAEDVPAISMVGQRFSPLDAPMAAASAGEAPREAQKPREPRPTAPPNQLVQEPWIP